MEFIALDNEPFSVVVTWAFTDWSSTGTHYQVKCAIFQMLPYRSYTVIESLVLASRHTMQCRLSQKDKRQITLFDVKLKLI
jgi:hypothetical protein